MTKFLNYVFIGSLAMAIGSTLLMLSFGILAVWMDLSEETVMDAVVTWYLSIIMFFITGSVSAYVKMNL